MAEKKKFTKAFFKQYDKYYIGIQIADGHNHCIRGWYVDQRFNHEDCPKGCYLYEFRSSDDDEDDYICSIEPFVWVNHSGTFVTRTIIPFMENGNKNYFKIRYGRYY